MNEISMETRQTRKRKISYVQYKTDIYCKKSPNVVVNKKKSHKKNSKTKNEEKIRRNSEKRKEKSRDAARSRRGKESEIFNQLASTLPLPLQSVAQLDKASIMRLCIAYLKTRALASKALSGGSFTSISEEYDGCKSPQMGKLELDSLWGENEGESTLLEALDGFLMVLSQEGDVIYCSQNISALLGISQVDVMGQSLMDFVHPCDHEEFRSFTGTTGPNPRHAFLRMKSTLAAKGRSINLKSASHKVIQMAGQLFHSKGGLEMGKGGVEGGGIKEEDGQYPPLPNQEESWIIAMAIPVPHPSNIEIPLDKQTFISKHSLDMKFTYVDKNVSSFCGYNPDDLIGRSLYELHHALDSHNVKEAYKTLRQKGQVETASYRFLTHGGGFIWVVTQATLITGPKENKPQYVVCLNYVVSDIEEKGQIFSDLQLKAALGSTSNLSLTQSVEEIRTPLCKKSECCKVSLSPQDTPVRVFSGCLPIQSPEKIASLNVSLPKAFKSSSPITPTNPLTNQALDVNSTKLRPVAATFQLLRSRTEDMNEGYLTFTDNDPQAAVLEEKPKDLTHLAPSGGDDCIPLDTPVYMPDIDNFLCEVKAPSMVEPYDSFLSSTSLSSFPPSKRHLAKKKQPISSPTITSASHADDGIHSPLSESVHSPLIRTCGTKKGARFILSSFGQEDSIQRAPPSIFDCFDSSSVSSFDTTESRYSPAPLLSQSASNPSPSSSRSTSQSSSPINRPRPRGAFYEDCTTNHSTMDIFDLKLEDDDMDLKNPIDEMFDCERSDFYSPCQETLSPALHFSQSIENLEDDSSLLKCHLRPPKDSPFLRSHSPCSHPKLSETGGNFVDPNQVLPGHNIIKGEDDDSSQELRHLLEDTSPISIKNQIETPPPLSESSKRFYSPACSPVMGNKRIRRPSFSNRQQQEQRMLSSLSGRERTNSRKCSPDPIPPVPNAPTMQRLLVSKEPITVQGRFISSPSSSTAKPSSASKSRCGKSPSSSTLHSGVGSAWSGANGSDSVLRNLLVSGRDDLAGYTVVVSSISQSAHASPNSSPNNPPTPHSISSWRSSKGSKNYSSIESEDGLGLPSLSSLDAIPVNQDGKFEFTREELASLLTSAGLSGASRLPFMAKTNSPVPQTSCSSVPSSSTMSPFYVKPQKASEPSPSPSYPSKGFKLQDPCLLVNPNVAIPSLMELTSFDYDVNAPAPSTCLLQGADLLMALDQAL